MQHSFSFLCLMCMRKSTILKERVHMGIRLFSAVIMSHPTGIPNNIRFKKMFRPLIEKKRQPNYARKMQE